jgi:NAD(P)-dependent dehydrogenase (short-subunit alcohol dehydrogenase family)
MFEAATSGQDEAKAYMTGLHPIGRVGTPLEVANAVLFLSTEANLALDGNLQRSSSVHHANNYYRQYERTNDHDWRKSSRFN